MCSKESSQAGLYCSYDTYITQVCGTFCTGLYDTLVPQVDRSARVHAKWYLRSSIHIEFDFPIVRLSSMSIPGRLNSTLRVLVVE